jgi:hypothetical protein
MLAGIFSGLSNINTGSTRSFSHSLTWGINFAVITNMLQFVWRKCSSNPRRQKMSNHCSKMAPFYLLLLALFLIMCDLTRHLLNDDYSTHCDKTNDVPGGSGLPSKYGTVCYETPFLPMSNPDGSLSTLGLLSSVIFTWTGFAFMFIAIFWAIDFPRKMKKQWRRIQRDRQARQMQSAV